ncbi:MAG: hypothetical protein FJX77_00790 [Armatimonadetes bacterium]|nr:hypothetical protein [Armatimonadota bacterium]
MRPISGCISMLLVQMAGFYGLLGIAGWPITWRRNNLENPFDGSLYAPNYTLYVLAWLLVALVLYPPLRVRARPYLEAWGPLKATHLDRFLLGLAVALFLISGPGDDLLRVATHALVNPGPLAPLRGLRPLWLCVLLFGGLTSVGLFCYFDSVRARRSRAENAQPAGAAPYSAPARRG